MNHAGDDHGVKMLGNQRQEKTMEELVFIEEKMISSTF